MASRIYLDHAATTPILPQAKAAMTEALLRWANPSSPHAEGRAARHQLEDARERIKQALGWTGSLIFTSGATEALAIALGRSERRVLASAVEHDALFRAAPNAQLLPIAGKAEVCEEALHEQLKSGGPALVAIQHVNSETGVMQPISRFTEQVRIAGGVLLSDCSQSAGKVPLPDADMIVLSAHKLGGPPGIGALLVRDLAVLHAVGGQEYGYRAGTQNVPGALGFSAAAEAGSMPDVQTDVSASKRVAWLLQLQPALAALEHSVRSAGGSFQPCALGEAPPIRGEWIMAVTMRGVSAAAQLIRFDAAGIAVSAGSACSSGTLKTSRALAAFGVPEDAAACTIRISIGWSTTAEELSAFQTAWLSMAAQAAARAA